MLVAQGLKEHVAQAWAKGCAGERTTLNQALRCANQIRRHYQNRLFVLARKDMLNILQKGSLTTANEGADRYHLEHWLLN